MEGWASEIGEWGDAPLSSSVTSLHGASLVTFDNATLYTVNMADELSDKHAISVLKDVFEGSRLRKRKRVLKHIAKQESSAVRALINEHGIENVSDVAVNLLKDGMFASPALVSIPPPTSHHNRETRQLGRTLQKLCHRTKLHSEWLDLTSLTRNDSDSPILSPYLHLHSSSIYARPA